MKVSPKVGVQYEHQLHRMRNVSTDITCHGRPLLDIGCQESNLHSLK